MLITFLKEAYGLAKIKNAERKERLEKANIARLFNDRYTYREEFIQGMEELPGTAVWGLLPKKGYAWMCPECNKIHHPNKSSVFSGLQYPACCSTWDGHRLFGKIRYK